MHGILISPSQELYELRGQIISYKRKMKKRFGGESKWPERSRQKFDRLRERAKELELRIEKAALGSDDETSPRSVRGEAEQVIYGYQLGSEAHGA